MGLSDVVGLERLADATPSALIFDSPHSGNQYPADFDYALDLQTLRRSEDAFVEELFGAVVDHGGVMLHARFPRCYIDPNRALTDIDVDMIAGQWPHPAQPTAKVSRGAGLIWRQVKKYGSIYQRQLTVPEVQRRIAEYWQPYHDAIRTLMDQAHQRHGMMIHINCHSMASMGDYTTEDGAVPRPDFILGDRDGSTCHPLVTSTVAKTLRDKGYQVVLNDPYKGQELVRQYSSPAQGRHSLQIETNRALYLDEMTVQKTAGFDKLQRDLGSVTAALIALLASEPAKLRAPGG